MAASMPPRVPQPARAHRTGELVGGHMKSCLSRVCRTSSIGQRALRTALTVHTDHLHWSLPAHRRRTLRGMDAA
ncbi:hypothetical protein XarjCFBP1022_06205 [Xanthomonas arboricola]|nr:hypothetical protein XarjCFBP1022_06205 [Xanthomonas arboricola]